MSVFDGMWSISAGSNADFSHDANGVLVGNGKMALFPCHDAVDMTRVAIATRSRPDQEATATNLLDAFAPYRVVLYNPSNAEVPLPMQMQTQQLNMYTGIFTATFACTDSNFPVSVSYDVFAVRQYPFSSVQTVRISAASNIPGGLGIQHETWTSACLVAPEFQTSSIYNEASPNQGAVYFVEGQASTSLTDRGTLAVSSAYSYSTDFTNLGFNLYRNDTSRCYNRFLLASPLSGTTYTMSIASTQLTDADFRNAPSECRRVSLNMVLKGGTTTASIAQVRSDHISAWRLLWKGAVNIAPKIGITTQEAADIQLLTRSLRFCMYNVYASTRENAVPALPFASDPNLAALDVYGNISKDGDMWLVPVLLLFQPAAARAILEYRFRQLGAAVQRAAAYGDKGARYPYVNDLNGAPLMYWDLTSPSSVFNSALIAISAWNYYRVTQDDEWLASTGYPILKQVADFFASKVEVDDDCGAMHLTNVSGLDPLNPLYNDAAMTNYMVRLAVKYTIESSYQVNAFVKDIWLQIFYTLPVPTFPSLPGVIAPDAESTVTSTQGVLETLLPLIPYYSFIFYKVDLNLILTAPAANLAHWEAYTDPTFASYPPNMLMRALLHAQCAWLSTVPTDQAAHLATLTTLLSSVLSSNTTPIWGNLLGANADSRSYNDITLSALFVLVFVMGVAGVNIHGGVAETRFYYETFRIDGLHCSVMPTTWRSVSVTGLGALGKTVQAVNTLLYP